MYPLKKRYIGAEKPVQIEKPTPGEPYPAYFTEQP